MRRPIAPGHHLGERSELPLFRQQGVIQSSRARLVRDLGPSDHRHQLLQQLRAYHFREKLIPHMIIRGLAQQDHANALALALERGSVGETLSGGRNERTNPHVMQTICDLLDRLEASEKQIAATTDRLCRRSAGT